MTIKPTSTATVATYIFPSDLGWIALAWRDKLPKRDQLLTRVSFGHPSAAAASAALEIDDEQLTIVHEQDVPGWISKLAARFQVFAAGHDETFEDVPLDLSHLSAFQAQVVRACRRIGRGQVRSYGELAKAAGFPGAARAVGSVMSHNRYPIIVPCHRVVASGGSIGGFTARDGVNMKQRMLALEGVSLKRNNRPRRPVYA